MSNRKMWTCKDGRKIRIKDMTDSHLINTVNLLERKALEFKYNVPYPNFQGEMAQFCAEQEFDNLMESDASEIASSECPVYDDLVDEINHRKLKYDKTPS